MKALQLITVFILGFLTHTTTNFNSTSLPFYHLGECQFEFEKTTHYISGELSEGLSNIRLRTNAFKLNKVEENYIAFGAKNEMGEYVEGEGYVDKDGNYIQVTGIRSIHWKNGGWELKKIEEK